MGKPLGRQILMLVLLKVISCHLPLLDPLVNFMEQSKSLSSYNNLLYSSLSYCVVYWKCYNEQMLVCCMSLNVNVNFVMPNN